MKKFLLALLLMHCSFIFAQIKYEPGYFIDNTGAKTECFIRNVGWLTNPESFDYKLNENENSKQQKINNIAIFETGGYKFERYTVKMERSVTGLDDLDSKPIPDFATETLYLKLLVSGKIALYSYRAVNVEKFFFKRSTDSVPQLLLYKRYNDDRKVKENNHYLSQLAYIFEIINSQRDFATLKYDEQSLVDFFTKNNGNNTDLKKETAINKTINQSKSEFLFKITAAAYMGTFKTSVYQSRYYQDAHVFDSKPLYAFGIEAEYILPFNHNKWSVFLSPEYYHYKKEETGRTFPGLPTTEKWSADLNYIAAPLGLRYYMYLTPKFCMYVDGAYVGGFKVGRGEISTDNNSYDTYLRGSWMIGAGFSYDKRFYIAFRAYTERRYNTSSITWADYYSRGIVLSYRII